MDLSIIIPAYNVQDYISRCLNSIMSFEAPAIELECLVIDDGSTDQTAEIVKSYMEKDYRIRLIEQKNGGVSSARNHGIDESKGKYIMFLDADDYLCEDAYQYISEAVQNEHAEYMAYSYLTLYENGQSVLQTLPIHEEVSTDIREGNRLMYADSVFNTCWGKLFRRDIICQNQIAFRTDLPIGEDFLFVAQYYNKCNTIYMCKQPILYYYQRSGSAMRSYSLDKRLQFTQILYTEHRKIVEKYQDADLLVQMSVYYVKVLTNMLLEYALIETKEELEKDYQNMLNTSVVKTILNNVQEEMIPSGMKRMEYRMLSKQNVGVMIRYFKLKSKFRR